MNEQTTKLLEQLANKLGTTSEYIWSILIRQAPIDSTITLIQIALIALFGFILYRFHVKFSRKNEDGNSVYYNDFTGFYIAMMGIGAIIFTILLSLSFSQIPSVFNGYFNPEYWALKEILDSIQ